MRNLDQILQEKCSQIVGFNEFLKAKPWQADQEWRPLRFNDDEICLADVDLENKVVAFCIKGSDWQGGNTCTQYWELVGVYKDGQTSYFVETRRRQSDGYEYYCTYLCEDIKLESVNDRQITVKIKGQEAVDQRFYRSLHLKLEPISEREVVFKEFRPAIPSPKETLSCEEQKQFMEKYDLIKQKLTSSLYISKGTMPQYADLDFQKQASTLALAPTSALDFSKELIPYEKPIVQSELVDAENGIAAIVIQSQIDYGVELGKQYRFTSFVVDKEGCKEIGYSACAYQKEIQDGDFEIPVARKILSEFAKKDPERGRSWLHRYVNGFG